MTNHNSATPMPRPFILMALLAVGSLISCDSGSDDQIESGMYEATFTGDSETTFEGRASFTRATSTTGGEELTLLLVDIGGDPILTARFDQSPESRAYRLNEDDAPTVLSREPRSGVQMIGTSGALTVSSHSSSRLAGAIEATLEEPLRINDTDRLRIQVFALFDANIRQ